MSTCFLFATKSYRVNRPLEFFLRTLKPRSTQHIPTLLAHHLQTPAKRSQHFSATYRNIVRHNMLCAFGHPVATCCDMLGIENRTSAHAWTQHCCANLTKGLQHHATSTNIALKKLDHFSNLCQQHSTCRNMSQHL